MKGLLIPALLVAALLAGAGSALAQVGAPSLLPDEVFTTNPAAMQWDDASRVVLGYGRERVNPQGEDYDTEGSRAGLLGLWSWGALSAEGSRFRETGGDREERGNQLRGALSLKIAEWLSVGVLDQETSYKVGDSTFLVDLDSSILAYGASLRIAEVLYAGYAQGRDRIDGKLVAGAPANLTAKFSDTRNVVTYGGGIRLGETLRLHAEYFVLDYDPVKIPANDILPQAVEFDEHTDGTGVLEVGWHGFVLGGRWTTSDQKSDDRKDKIAEYSVAWIPESGLGLAYRYQTDRTRDNDTGDLYEKRTGQTISLVYLF